MEHVMSKSFQPTRLVGAIAIAMGCSPVIFAEDATNATQLDPIVITASKSAEKASEVPARISVIDEKTIEQNPIADLPSLLRKEAGLTIHQTGGYGQTAPYLSEELVLDTLYFYKTVCVQILRL